ncbi:V13 [Acanthamoeba polyphaga mimivirus]|nr:V13 [Mimivirus reunion]WMV61344.1 V13 [Mimivirus sp.]WMV62321.1 V13 [Acanthamoeba polyphaga mimivirus]QTF49867.1 V13 [Mimivirus reunion]WMV62310.1 V13 [Mimivirus sp.]
MFKNIRSKKTINHELDFEVPEYSDDSDNSDESDNSDNDNNDNDSDNDNNVNNDNSDSNYVYSDNDCQKKLFKLVGKDKFKFCNGKLWIFNDETGIFENNNRIIFRYLERYTEHFDRIVSKDKKGNIKTKNYATNEALRKKIIFPIKINSEDDKWMSRTQMSSLGYLLFEDGIYNFKTGTFTKGFDPNIVFKFSVPWKFPKYDKDLIEKAYNLSFGSLFDDPKPMITSLACALAGKINLKKMYFCPGKMNSGKSILVKMLQYCFGSYIGIFHGEELLYRKNDKRKKSSRMGWAYTNKDTRIMISNFMPTNASLDRDIIKNFVSGYEIVFYTKGWSQECFTPSFTIFCVSNDIPEIEPHDEAISDRLVYHEFPYVFVKEEDLNKKPYNKLRDNDLDSKFETEDFVNGFIHILLDAYKDYLENDLPKFDNKVKEKWTVKSKQIDKVITIIKEHYEITNNDKDIIQTNEIHKFKNQHKELKDISLNRFYEILEEKLKLINGRSASSRFWKGLKRK